MCTTRRYTTNLSKTCGSSYSSPPCLLHVDTPLTCLKPVGVVIVVYHIMCTTRRYTTNLSKTCGSSYSSPPCVLHVDTPLTCLKPVGRVYFGEKLKGAGGHLNSSVHSKNGHRANALKSKHHGNSE